jgi:two-component system alkaline phosphatase synthesis response regulator PhoP
MHLSMLARDSTRARVRQVLIVDDDYAIRHALQTLLEDEGYQVHTAADGAAAVQILRASRDPLPVFLDVMMPRMDGLEVLRAAESDPNLNRHIFTLMTAMGRTLPLEMVKLMGTMQIELISKPFDDINIIPLHLMRMEQRLS